MEADITIETNPEVAMMAAGTAAGIMGIVLLVTTVFFAIRGNTDRVILFGVALTSCLSPLISVVAAVILAAFFGYKGDGQKVMYAIAGLILGLILFVGVMAVLEATGIIEGGA